jgi:hypothetical protein
MMKSDRRVNFTVHCPNGHEKALDYDLENLRIWLKAAVFQVTCIQFAGTLGFSPTKSGAIWQNTLRSPPVPRGSDGKARTTAASLEEPQLPACGLWPACRAGRTRRYLSHSMSPVWRICDIPNVRRIGRSGVLGRQAPDDGTSRIHQNRERTG